MNDLTIYEQINALFSSNDIEMLEKFEEIKTKVEVMTKERNKALLPIMEQYYKDTGNNTFDTGRLKFTYKKAFTRRSVDTKALKEQGLYEQFTKESEVSPSVSVSISYD